MRRSCSDSPVIASQMDEVFGSDRLNGGCEGAKSRLTLHPGTPRAQIMPSSCRVELVPGDSFEIRAAAGGGFGPPQEREGLHDPRGCQNVYEAPTPSSGREW
jgi:N-methylhydantoinase B/oxoprolinase/acetone carboxylase alpha subunit